jgi:lipopolysaccharide export system permease protein
MIYRLLSVYIATRFAMTMMIILAMLSLIACLVDYLDVLRRYADAAEFTAMTGVKLTAMRVPIVLEVMFPFIFLFGAIIGLTEISRNSELVVARASGVSVWGFLRGPLAVALLFGVTATAMLNPMAVTLKHVATNLEAELLGMAPRDTGHWFRQEGGDGQSIVHAGSANNNGRTLFGVTAFVFDKDGQFREKVVASRAEFAGERWILTDATVLSATSRRHAVGQYELPTRLRPDQLQIGFLEPDAISVWALPNVIETAGRIGLNPDRFRVAFHTLLSRPFMLVAMVLLAATVSLRLSRYGGAWRLILTGAAVGFLLYSANEIVSDFGANGIIHPVLAAWVPPIVALTFGATALLYQEDG